MGTGTLLVNNGGSIDTEDTFIGNGTGGTGTATVTGADSLLINSDQLIVGKFGQGTLNVTAGGQVQNTFGQVGVNGGSTGAVTVTGPGSTWTSSGSLRVGVQGMGTLNITSGGSTSNSFGFIGLNSGSNGMVIVEGAGSTWINSDNLHIGEEGQGTLNIASGGAVSNQFGNIGHLANSVGAVSVIGPGSTWTNNVELVVGDGGTGTLDIMAGGAVSNTNAAYIGFSSTSDGAATVDGAGSTWTNNGNLCLGDAGDAVLEISADGRVTNNIGVIGDVAGSTGMATVAGAGSTWTNSGDLSVGEDGMGTINILGAGSVSNINGFIAKNAGSNGTTTVCGAGSNWETSGRLSIAGDALNSLNGGTGTLTIQPGGTVSVAQDIILFPDGTLNLEGGTLDTEAISFQGGGQFNWTPGTLHVEVFNGNLLNQDGTLAPGHSAGDTLIQGNYTQQSPGAIEIEIGGLGQGTQFDFVNVTGNALLDGELELKLINGFLPNPSQTFVVFNAASLIGVLDNAGNGQRVTTSNGDGSFLVHYGPASPFNQNQIVLTAFELASDYNQNGVVDAADYAVWRDNLGAVVGTLENDADGGVIGAAQYNTWVANFGNPGSGAGTGAAVPELATLYLLLLVGFVAVAAGTRFAARANP